MMDDFPQAPANKIIGNGAGAPERPVPLEPDRNQLEIFVDATLRHAFGARGFVSVRSFYEDDDDGKPFRITAASPKSGLTYLVTVTVDDARRAAQVPKRVVFCPPIAVFADKTSAKESNVLAGLVVSVECDQFPQEALARLTALLGPPDPRRSQRRGLDRPRGQAA
jgi:hypothetical protein